MDIQDMRIFARVAAVQNLSSVGLELGLTPGTISKRLQALERELSARLFDRTTRSIRITEEGSKLLDHVERILSELERAKAAVQANVDRPQGKLRISAPVSFGRHEITPAICAFMARYDEIEVHIDLTDRIVHLQDDNYDVAIRAGTLNDSGMRAKRLVDDPQIVVAAPCYIERHGEPEHPVDLERHASLVHCDQNVWTFLDAGEEVMVRVNGRLRSDNGRLLQHAAIEGLGFLKASAMRVAEDIERGLLQRVLPAYALTPPSAIYAVYPGTIVLPKLRVLLDFLGVWFADRPGSGRKPNGAGASRNGAGRLQAPKPIPDAAMRPGNGAGRTVARA